MTSALKTFGEGTSSSVRWGRFPGGRRMSLPGRRAGLEVRGQPKTGAGMRTVTLPTVAAEALAEHLGVYAEVGPDGLVFPAEQGGPLRRSNFTRQVSIPATRAAGMDDWPRRTGVAYPVSWAWKADHAG